MKKEAKLGLAALKRALGKEQVITESSELRRCSMDDARLSFLPDAVVHPRDDVSIGKLLRLANRYGIAVTTRGAGTATTGATSPLHGGWVLDLSGWKKIRIDTQLGMAHVEAGVVNHKVNQLAEPKGWFYPPDPSSLKYSTIGGNLATNAGGLRGAKYGVTRDYVYALEGFLPTGEAVTWGAPLKKFASGYNIRDLWIGSEGTLGVITRATLKLVPRPAARWTGLLAYRNEGQALRTALKLMKARVVPAIMEFLDCQTVDCVVQQTGRPIVPKHPRAALLLIELDGHPQAVADERVIIEKLAKESNALYSESTDDPVEAERLWQARRLCSQAMFQHGDTKLNEDIVVPPKSYLPLLKYTLQLKKETGLATPTFGHVADGNFHVHLMYDREDAKQAKAAERGVQQLMEKVVALGGVITGEHGIGLAKSSFLQLQHNSAEITAMQSLKKALDPQGILNPGKIFEPFQVWEHPRDYAMKLPWRK